MGKNNRKKQGAFFKAFSRSPHSISRTFELAVPTKKPSCFLNIKGSFLPISVVKLTVFKRPSKMLPPSWQASNVSTSLCLVFSILPNIYEIKTNFPQNYNVFRQSFIDGNNLVKMATTHWNCQWTGRVTDIAGSVYVVLVIIDQVCFCLCSPAMYATVIYISFYWSRSCLCNEFLISVSRFLYWFLLFWSGCPFEM